ncbi:MAG: hypothetical protein AAF378_17090 [Cyanobacteria bacterium P01_A01_bin.84]
MNLLIYQFINVPIHDRYHFSTKQTKPFALSLQENTQSYFLQQEIPW